VAIQAYSEQHESAVRQFNERLKAGGSPFKFPAPGKLPWPARIAGRATFMDGFVAIENDAVRGGYLIKHQPFALGEVVREDVANLQLPLSEGSIDPAFSRIGVQILAAAVRGHPLLYALGMGGIRTPLPSVLRGMGWTTQRVPFFFRVARPVAFLRNIRILRTTPARCRALDVAAASGVGALAFAAVHAAMTRPSLRSAQAELVQRFEEWADAIWERARSSYSLIALRNADELNALYAGTDRRPIRLRVTSAGRDIGWAVVFDTQLSNHKQFGDMRLGTLVDCLALPGEEIAVVRAATDHLLSRGVDLVIGNQSHVAWREALRRRGYLAGPSNYGLAMSKGLVAALMPSDANLERIHMTRGDGDGPIHI
jgi:hypothetical protein